MLNLFKRKKKEPPIEPAREPLQEINVSNYDAPTIMITKQEQIEALPDDVLLAPAAPPPTEMPYYAVETGISTHIGTRNYQQDSGFVSESLTEVGGEVLGIVCDGMGGMSSGELASADVVKFFIESLTGADKNTDIPSLLVRVTHESNEMLHMRYTRQGNDTGTTLSCVYLKGSSLYWVSVGDSRIFIIRGNEMVSLTREHNHALQLSELVESGRMTQEEANASKNREALVSYIGAPTLDYIDISNSPLALQENDMILICSDGLTKTLSEQIILQQLSEREPVPSKVHRLVITAIDESLGGQDNTTAILIRYNGDIKPAVSI